jgi:hypothetical protein
MALRFPLAALSRSLSGTAAVFAAGQYDKASSFVCVDDRDRDDDQPPAHSTSTTAIITPFPRLRPRDHGHDYGDR